MDGASNPLAAMPVTRLGDDGGSIHGVVSVSALGSEPFP
jgi:hypothetical protein